MLLHILHLLFCCFVFWLVSSSLILMRGSIVFHYSFQSSIKATICDCMDLQKCFFAHFSGNTTILNKIEPGKISSRVTWVICIPPFNRYDFDTSRDVSVLQIKVTCLPKATEQLFSLFLAHLLKACLFTLAWCSIQSLCWNLCLCTVPTYYTSYLIRTHPRVKKGKKGEREINWHR